MINEKLTLALYTSTKGHFGFKNSYKFTVESLQENFEFFKSITKVAHVKCSSGEEEVFSEMEDWLKNRGFYVIKTLGDWSHNDETNSHAKGYFRDMLTTFSTPQINDINKPFCFVCEDDQIFNSKVSTTWLFEKGINFLNKEPDSLCIRINSNYIQEEDPIQSSDNLILKQGTNKQYGPTFTFQPTIVRTQEWRHSLRYINQNLHLLDTIHCEILSGEVLKTYSDSATPFCYFYPDMINCKHIGEKEILEELNYHPVM